MSEKLDDTQDSREGIASPANRIDPTETATLLVEVWRLRADLLTMFSREIDEISWNILLDLYVSGSTGRPVVASDLAYAYEVRKTTMIRRVDYLHEIGMIDKDQDPLNKVRVLLTLTESGLAFLTDALEEIGNKFSKAAL